MLIRRVKKKQWRRGSMRKQVNLTELTQSIILNASIIKLEAER